jgi:hypothetical protein
VFQRGQGRWDEGVRLLHAYVTVDLDRPEHRDLARLITGLRAASADAPLAHIDHEWLHVTLYQLPDPPAPHIPDPQRRALVAELTARVRGVKPFVVNVGGPVVYPSGIVCDLVPHEPGNALRAATAAAFETVFGLPAGGHETGAPHLTESYTTAEASLDAVHDLARRVRRVRPSHAPLHVEAVELVEVSADTDRKVITWEPVAAPIRLGAQ